MNIDPVNVLKWAGIVLAAGFVGYFGRYLAMRLIARMGNQKEPGAAPPSPSGQADAKLEKKRAKQAAKAAKKAGK